MITSSKNPGYQYLRKIMVLPVAAIVLVLFAFNYKESNKVKGNDNLLSIPDQSHSKDFTKITPVYRIPWTENFLPLPPKKIPSTEQLKLWSDTNQYRVWMEGKWINNSKLTKYKPSDFGFYSVFEGEKNDSNYDKNVVYLFTRTSYVRASRLPEVRTTYMTWRDTIRPLMPKCMYEQSLIVLDGEIKYDININNIDEKISVVNIESVTVLKGPSAIKKYGDKADCGVIEIKTIKGNPYPRVENAAISDTIKPGHRDVYLIFEKVEIEPSFPGGVEKWKEYIANNLDASIPIKNKAPKGDYSVVVQFIVSLDGTVTDIKPLTKHGYGMEEEAVRIIKNGPKWLPAIQNGHKVVAYRKQIINFFTKDGKKIVPEKPGTPVISLVELKNISPQKLLQLEGGTEITSFMFTIWTRENDDISWAYNAGDQFSEVTKKLIADAKQGQTIIVDQIRTRKDGIEKKMRGKVYEVIN